jgi:hypothetical protein
MNATPQSLIDELMLIICPLAHVYYINWSPKKQLLSVGFDPIPDIGRPDLTLLQQQVRREWDDECTLSLRKNATRPHRRDTTLGHVLVFKSPAFRDALGLEQIKGQWPRIGKSTLNTGVPPVRKLSKTMKIERIGIEKMDPSQVKDFIETRKGELSKNEAFAERQRLKSKAMGAITRQQQGNASAEDLELLKHYHALGRRSGLTTTIPAIKSSDW